MVARFSSQGTPNPGKTSVVEFLDGFQDLGGRGFLENVT